MKTKIPTMLHVEDDENDRVLLKFAQQRAHVRMNIVAVEDGEEAVSYLKGEGAYSDRVCSPAPALVLLDLKLPRKGGFEVLDWIRTQKEFRDLPVIVLSSSALERDLLRAFQSGASSYFVKPVSFTSLVTMVQQIYCWWLADTGETSNSFQSLELTGQCPVTSACSVTSRSSAVCCG
jgi:CheY-like chemotaxis protein